MLINLRTRREAKKMTFFLHLLPKNRPMRVTLFFAVDLVYALATGSLMKPFLNTLNDFKFLCSLEKKKIIFFKNILITLWHSPISH